jgi:hypothetical protein
MLAIAAHVGLCTPQVRGRAWVRARGAWRRGAPGARREARALVACTGASALARP